MPAPHDLDPPAMTNEERLAKRRYQAWHAFEQMPGPLDFAGRLEATFDGTVPLDGSRLAATIAATVPEVNAHVYAVEFHERLAEVRRVARERARARLVR